MVLQKIYFPVRETERESERDREREIVKKIERVKFNFFVIVKVIIGSIFSKFY